MVQVQSSWFPLYDRNPQTFVPNIFWAKPEDYKKATQRIYHSADSASFVELPVVEGRYRLSSGSGFLGVLCDWRSKALTAKIAKYAKNTRRKPERGEGGSGCYGEATVMKKSCFFLSMWAFLALVVFPVAGAAAGGLRFSVSFPKSQGDQAIDGRMFVLLSTDPSDEPRMQIDDSPRTQMMFGMDVDGLKPGQAYRGRFGAWAIRCDTCTMFRRATTTCRRCFIVTRRFIARRPHGEAADGPRRRPALEHRAGQSVLEAAEDHARAQPRAGRASFSIRRFRRFPSRKTPSTSGTSKSRASC